MTTTRGSNSPTAVGAPPRPRRSPLASYDAAFLVALNVGVVTWMWYRHGGLSRTGSFDDWLVAVGQLAGLYAALAVLLGLVLVSRAPWLERRYGMDQMVRAHRWTGFTAAWLIVTHVAASTFGLARDTGISLWDQIVDYWRNYPYLINAIVGFGLLMLVVVMSTRPIRSRIAYEVWWLIHLTTYAAVALGFGHQTAIGADFVLDSWAVAFWVALYLSVAFLIFGYRWVALVWRLVRHRAQITEVIPEGSGVVTLVVTGRHLDRLPSEAGQFFILRVLRRDSWWRAHPFSVSAPPDGTTLRFTIKALGDDTTALQTIAPGTRVALEGPYGGFLDVLPTARPMVFIAGGIGITPFRGLIEDLDRPEDVTLVYRNRRPADAVFREDLERLSQELGFALHLSYSRHGEERDPFSPAALARVAPRLSDSDVFVIGSPPFVAAARRGLRQAGIPARRIHLESFSY